MWPEQQIFWIAVAYRVCNCFIVQTWFVPDEYWQSLEPAHKLAFGYGYLTWEWQHGIRSYLYPLIIASIYKFLEFVQLDYRSLLIIIPRLCQSLFGAVADIYFYKFVKRLFGETVAVWTMMAYLLNWFELYCNPRTLANTVETHLLCIGLCLYPWPDEMLQKTVKTKYPARLYLVLATIGTYMRPTSAIIWLPLCFYHFWRVPNKFEFLFRTIVFSICPVVLLCLYVDRICYGRWVFSLWNFAQFNFFSDGSAHFGVHPWHWYFTNGLPTVCLTNLILIVFGLFKSKCRWIGWLCLWYIFVHSLLPHKELRFMLPILPLLNVYSGLYINSLASSSHDSQRNLENNERKKFLATTSLDEFVRGSSKRAKALIAFLFVTNMPVLLYTGLLHQRGCLDVPKQVHDIGLSDENVTFWFLTPCHSTPYYSHIHLNMSLRFLTCEPNFNFIENYVDESDVFHSNPEKWLKEEFQKLNATHSSIPTHLLIYEWLWLKSKLFFEKNGYKKCEMIYNTDFPQSSRQSQYFFILCKHPKKKLLSSFYGSYRD